MPASRETLKIGKKANEANPFGRKLRHNSSKIRDGYLDTGGTTMSAFYKQARKRAPLPRGDAMYRAAAVAAALMVLATAAFM